jgi:predicted small metal-binding protein
MTYSLECGAVMPGCAATFEGESKGEILDQVGPHVAEAHGISEVPPDVLEAVKAAIKRN